MILKLYKKNHPAVILLVLLLAGIIWALSFYKANSFVIASYNFEMPFYYWIYNWLHKYPLLSRLGSFIMVLIHASLINRLNNKYFLLESRTYLPSLVYVLFCSIVPLQNLHPILFSNFFLLISIDKIFSTYRNDKLWSNYFDVGILIAISSLFYIKFAFFLVIVWFSLFILRPFRGREWMLSVIGFIIPYLFVATYFFIFEENIRFKFNLFFSQLIDRNGNFEYNYVFYTYFILLALLTLISSQKIISTLRKQKVSVRRFFQVFFWLFVLSLVLLVVENFSSPGFISVAAISLSFIVSNYMLTARSAFWKELIFTMLLGTAILFQIYYHTTLLR